MMRYLLAVMLLLQASFSFAQQDSNSTDTSSNNPVIIINKFEVEEQEYKEVYNYFYIKPSVSYHYFFNDYCHKSDLLSQAYCYSVREKGGYSGGLDFGYNYRNYNFLLGYSVNTFSERVNDYKRGMLLRNRYSLQQLTLKFLYVIKLKKINIAPYAGISYIILASSNTTYPTLDENRKIQFQQINDFQQAGSWLFHAGAELRFFNTHRVSPFVGYEFSVSPLPEGNKKKYGVSFYKYISNFTGGILIKY